MRARGRRIIEMVQRVVAFCQAHVDPSAGFTAAMAYLGERLQRAETIAAQQQAGIAQVRASTGTKHGLILSIRTLLDHIGRIAVMAAADAPELAQRFALLRNATTHLAFRTAARGMQEEAVAKKDVLVSHGLVDSLLDELGRLLDQFDTEIQRGTEGRRAHVGASAELEVLANELLLAVQAMDGFNQFRFADNPELLAAWVSARNVVATPKSRAPAATPAPEGTPPAGGEKQPAA